VKEAVLITDKELCEIIRISPVTMRRLLKDKASAGIASIKRVMVGSQRRWCKASVMEFISGRRQGKL
jgi:hypothetical protein